jgi:hypothetical protein
LVRSPIHPAPHERQGAILASGRTRRCAALLALAAGGLLLDIPVSTGEARILRVNVLIGLLMPSLVYVPAILLLLADLRPRLAIKLRRGAEIGDTLCPLRLP